MHTTAEPTDLIVIGAGLTGLVAAWECQKRGHQVMLLEARDRVGGRTLTVEDRYNDAISHFDLGARFLGDHPQQRPLWELVRELGLETMPQYTGPGEPGPEGADEWSGLAANLLDWAGRTTAYIGALYPPSEAGVHYMKYLNGLLEDFPIHAPHKFDNASEHDRLSVREWVEQLSLPDHGPAPESFHSLIRLLCRVGFSSEPEEISALWFLFYIASNGGLLCFQSMRWPAHGAQAYRLTHGAQTISKAIAERLTSNQRNCLRLDQQIVSVEDDAETGLVTVATTSGERWTAKKVLLAMAPRLYAKLTFEPRLPRQRIDAAASMPHAPMILAYVTFDTAFWRTNRTRYRVGQVNGFQVGELSRDGLSGNVLFTDGPLVWVVDNTSSVGQPALLVFMVGRAAVDLSDRAQAQREAIVLNELQRIFGDAVPSSRPCYHEKNWYTDPLSAGCPAAHFVPGAFFEHGRSILRGEESQPHGNVHFASTETALISNGYMAGAVWSGREVAHDIHAALTRQRAPHIHDPFARSLAMKWCVRTIVRAIQEESPWLEFPALTADVVFFGPGGVTLPSGPYVGKAATFDFYRIFAEHISITNMHVTNVSVDCASNTAYASWLASGYTKMNGNYFRDVECSMVFEFTPPQEPDVLVSRDWLILDTELLDVLASAAPAAFCRTQPSDAALEALSASASGLARLDPMSGPDGDYTIRVADGLGQALTSYGRAGLSEVTERWKAAGVEVQVISEHLDLEALTFYSWQRFTARHAHRAQAGGLLVTVRFDNRPSHAGSVSAISIVAAHS